MSIDQKIALGSCIGTLISSIIILLTLLEMNKQRKSAYRPDLLFSSTEFKIYGQEKGGKFIPQPFADPKLHSPIAINFINIGLGAAKNIKLTWDFDTDFFLKEIAIRNNGKAFEISWIPNAYLEITYKDAASRHLYTSKDCSLVNCVLPSNVISEPMIFAIPNDYLCLFVILRLLESQSDELHYLLEVPPLKVYVSYFDIGGNKIQNDFYVHLDAQSINLSTHNDENMMLEFINGTINAEPIKKAFFNRPNKHRVFKTLNKELNVSN